VLCTLITRVSPKQKKIYLRVNARTFCPKIAREHESFYIRPRVRVHRRIKGNVIVFQRFGHWTAPRTFRRSAGGSVGLHFVGTKKTETRLIKPKFGAKLQWFFSPTFSFRGGRCPFDGITIINLFNVTERPTGCSTRW